VPEQYVHRIGRTARAGADGLAISYVCGEEKGWLKQIEKLTGVRLDPVPLPADFDAQRAKLPKPAAGSGDRDRDQPRRGDARRPAPAGAARDDRPRRPFRPQRKPGGVGAHKGAVQRTGGR
jgi:ATP-dependent RNA helicase RhlE